MSVGPAGSETPSACLGRHTWNLVHRLPYYLCTPEEGALFRRMVRVMVANYPCAECRAHAAANEDLQALLAQEAPGHSPVQDEAAVWASRLHSLVSLSLPSKQCDPCVPPPLPRPRMSPTDSMCCIERRVTTVWLTAGEDPARLQSRWSPVAEANRRAV